MNEIINKFLLSGDKFTSELPLKQSGFTYCGLFTKHRKRMQQVRQTGNLKHLYRSELDKVCFAHDTAYSESKNSAKITTSYKI